MYWVAYLGFYRLLPKRLTELQEYLRIAVSEEPPKNPHHVEYGRLPLCHDEEGY